MTMKLNKEEFKVMVMLYAANIDGNIQSEEVKIMLEKTDFDTVEKVEKLFDKMSDSEILDCIRENKAQYTAADADKQELMNDLRAIVEADEKVSLMENQICKALEHILA